MKILIFIIISLVNFIINTGNQVINKSLLSKPQRLLQETIKCGLFTCPKQNAFCTGRYNETCICDDKYSSFPFDTFILCNYEKKKQLLTFLLELFLMFGIGHLYASNYIYGSIKCAFFLFNFGIFITVRILRKKTEENNTYTLILSLVGCVSCIVILIWQIVDVILIGLNRYLDGNGIELYPM